VSTRRSLAAAALAACTTVAAPALAQEVPDLGRLTAFIRWSGLVVSVPVIVVALIAMRFVSSAADRLSERFTERRPAILLAQSILRFLIYGATMAVTIALSLHLDESALTVIGGALAFAVGFAMRDVVAAFIAGITIMLDRPFQVGDRVTYGGQYGDIIKIGLRSVRMNTLDHNVVTIPNNKVLVDVTSSGNYGALEMQVAMDFYLGVDQDARLASELVREACLTSPYVFLKQPVPVTACQVILQDYVAIHLKARPYVFDVKYEKAFETDVHLRVLDAWREHAILPPAVLHRERSELVPSSARANGHPAAAPESERAAKRG
jgi:small-conductance mechanosensitive channel